MSRYDWGRAHPGIERLESAVEEARGRVVGHPMYASLDNHGAIVEFMEHHVFAVWDFMSLLKSLQIHLTSVRVPWLPTLHRASRHLINDIVTVEESDQVGDSYVSHFELYLCGMKEAGADTSAIETLIEQLRSGMDLRGSLSIAGVPAPSLAFTITTFAFIESLPLHCQAAAFAFGREDLIPDMFTQVVAVNDREANLSTFVDYLERHIEVDGEKHTPMAMQMLADLCGDDEEKWQACADTVNAALAARVELWDGILEAIRAGERGQGDALDLEALDDAP